MKMVCAVGAEYISCKTLAQAVRDLIDLNVWTQRNSGVGFETPDYVYVNCYVMHEWTADRISYWADDLIEFLVEKFHDDEDLCGEDGLELSITEMARLKENALDLVDKFAKCAPPQTLRYIGTIHLSMDKATKIIESMNQVPL